MPIGDKKHLAREGDDDDDGGGESGEGGEGCGIKWKHAATARSKLRRRGEEERGGKGRFAAADGATTTAKIARFDAPRRFDEEHGKRVFRAKHMQG